jgi:hypothetical protein
MQLEQLVSLLISIFLIASWYRWATSDRSQAQRTRRYLFLGGLLIASVDLILYLAFTIQNTRSQGPRPDFLRTLLWAKPGFWISIAALVLCFSGKGWSRVSSLVAALLMLGLWIIPIWGM